MQKEFWNERYGQSDFAYGQEPNQFLHQQLAKFESGKLLFPAEGEGRNAVFAATLGHEVFAFDQSSEGRKKALELAQQKNVTIDYFVNANEELPYSPQSFDGIALIYAHFPGPIKSAIHRSLNVFIKPGGYLIFEAFGKKHLDYVTKNPAVGGPKDIDTLFSIEEIQSDFPDFDFDILEEIEIELHEGLYHNGVGSVVRAVGRKKQQ